MNRRTNLALLVLVPGTAAMGLVANTIGTDWRFHPAILHGAMGLAVVALAPWKTVVVRRGLGRRRRGTWQSIALLVSVLVTVLSGLLHATDVTTRVGPVTVMQLHVGGGLLAVALVVAHYRLHPVRPRRSDVDRRAFLRLGALGGAASAMWIAWQSTAAAERLPTGSHERGSFQPNRFPVTSWLNDRIPDSRPDWVVDVDGARIDATEIQPEDTVVARLDCTSGWYTEQRWSGVRLDRLVDPAGSRSVEVTSVTGYSRLFPVRDLGSLHLVTTVGDEPLSPGHGAPVRLVAPGRRGFWWVKWVVSIRTTARPWWLQLPFPAE